MKKDWILDVLADLQTFAAKNDLTALEQQLAVATQVATRDLASNQIIAPAVAQRDVGHAGIIHRATERGPNA